MAAWQFSIEFIPLAWAEENQFKVDSLYGDEGYSTHESWRSRQPNSSFVEDLSTIAARSESWHQDLLTWGSTQEHDIQVWYENRIVSGMCIRLDLRHRIEGITKSVIMVAHSLGCALFLPELKAIIEADEQRLRSMIAISSAAAFVKDPRGFLESLPNDT